MGPCSKPPTRFGTWSDDLEDEKFLTQYLEPLGSPTRHFGTTIVKLIFGLLEMKMFCTLISFSSAELPLSSKRLSTVDSPRRMVQYI